MHLCYIDESGTFDVPGTSQHYVLAGISVPDWLWKQLHTQIEVFKRSHELEEAEIHVAWMMRPYAEQRSILGFDSMTIEQRRSAVRMKRREELYRLQRTNGKAFKQTKKTYKQTEAYMHLTLQERRRIVVGLAQLVSEWREARLFAECIDKVHFDPRLTGRTVHEQAFEQLVSRFERYLRNIQLGHGMLIHDNNQTVAERLTELMKTFLRTGTLWTEIDRVIETPMFVDSQLTNMVQIADLCAYALRRYLENGEEELFNLIFQRADRAGGTAVGVRHFTRPGCDCKICLSHNAPALPV